MDEPKNPPHRPPLPFDQKQFEQLCFIHCTEEEIASVLKMHVDTLREKCKLYYGMTFSEVYQEKSAGGKMSLRRVMWEKAVKKQDNTMMIWLSKNTLGMQDKTATELSGPNKGPVVVQSANEKVKKLLGDPNAIALIDQIDKVTGGDEN